MTTSSRAPLVLNPQEAANLVKITAPGSIAFIDASWHMPNSPRNASEEFRQKRLPGARFFDLDTVASPHELGLKHMMPSGHILAAALQSMGVLPSTHVVFYDSVGVFSSPRALFTLRSFGHENSSILNGGILRWESEGLEVESGKPQLLKPAGEYPAPTMAEDAIQSYEQIITNTKRDPITDEQSRIVFDARSRGRYEGADPEPRPGLSSGHMPRSLSLPFNTFLRTTQTSGSDKTFTTLLEPEELATALRNAVGKDAAQEALAGKRKITTTCGSGMTAAVLWLGLKQLNPDISVSIYDESWTGYAMRPESVIVKGSS